MTDLEELDITFCKVTNDAIKYLKTLPHLRSLKPDYTKITGDGAVELRRALPGIKISGAAAHYSQAGGCYYQRKYDETIAALTEALKFDPDYADAYLNRGVM